MYFRLSIRRGYLARFTLAIALMLLAVCPGQAADRSWINPAGGTFSTATNWQDGLVAGSDDRAIFNLTGQTFTVGFNADTTNSSLLLRNGNISFDLSGTTYMLAGGNTTIGDASGDNALLMITNGMLKNTSARIANHNNSQGTVTVSGAGSTWTNSSALYIGNSGVGTLTIIGGGNVSNTDGLLGSESGSHGMVTVSGISSTWTNGRDLTVGFGGTGTLTIAGGGRVANKFISWIGYSGGSHGTVTVTDPDSTWTIDGSLYIGGSDTSSGGQGFLNVSDGGRAIATEVIIWPTGTLSGSGGTVQANITNGGLVAPGYSPGVLNITGNYTQSTTGKLAVEIGSSNSFDRLLISGQASVGGKLEVALLAGFVPASGASFDILDWGSVNGTFSSVVLPSLPGGKAWDMTQLYVSGVLSVTGPAAVPGDFDSDGDVDGSDFVAWQTNFPKLDGATLAQGDADEDGDVDGADFVVWQTHFPSTPGPGASNVPEPSAFGAVLLAIIVFAARAKLGSRRRPGCV